MISPRLGAALAVVIIPEVTGAAIAAPVPATAEQNTSAAIERIKRIDPKIHAVIAIDPTALDQARSLDQLRRPRGALFGLPILVKDNIETAGPLATTAGSLALIDNVTGRDAPVIARLRAADAVILGKTNLSEWANIRSRGSVWGWSAVGGQTRNPYALDRDPCGSSSGSGAAVAAGMVDAAIGTETDGSITCPAAVNGIVGLKPTVGLLSRTHIVPISHSQDTAGPMTKDVTTAARLLAAMAGSDPGDSATVQADARRSDYVAALRLDALKGARIGVMRFAAGWSAPTDAAFGSALDILKAQGAILVEIAAFESRERIGPAEALVLDTEFKVGLATYLNSTPAAVKVRTLADVIAFNRAHASRELGLFNQDRFEAAEATKGLEDPEYQRAREVSRRQAGPDGIDALLAANNVTALVAPTMPPAWKIDTVNGDQFPGEGPASLAAVAGYPHLTVPMGYVKGLPVGISFVGPAWSEARLLGYGYAFEQASRVQVAPQFPATIEGLPPTAPLLLPLGKPLRLPNKD